MQSSNKSIYYRKTLIIFLMALSLLTTSQFASAISIKQKDYSVDRYTDTGLKDSNGVAIVKWEQGNLHIKEGFIPITSAEYSADLFKIDSATLSAINGKYVSLLSLWVSLHDVPYTDWSAFQRSKETYTIDGVPNVIVSLTGSSGGTGGGVVKGKPTVSLSADQPNASEAGPTNGRFLIEFDAPRTKKISVSYAITGTAKNGKDYTKIKGKVSIPAGETSASVDIAPIDDLKKESTEKVTLKLKSAGAYKLNKSKKSATVEITDND